ncbi:Mitochondrial import receptor subunit TOM5-like protein [Zea mays]|uniref:Mitochondrial import receptor subunit TOM5-like protein n=1 Tax=Zea mays TaxID=4577 RepID=A0A1D6KWT6_MAIZE|nr:Mitochondrial import receptor subunit TOM5-like protein [Zea mays]
MAASSAVEKLKVLWDSQVNDEEQWALNYVRTPFPSLRILYLFVSFFSLLGGSLKLLKAAGLFAGSIFLMRNFGDLMAI